MITRDLVEVLLEEGHKCKGSCDKDSKGQKDGCCSGKDTCDCHKDEKKDKA